MTLQQQIRANRWRTIWLLLLFALLVIGLGLLLSFVFDPTILTFVATWNDLPWKKRRWKQSWPARAPLF